MITLRNLALAGASLALVASLAACSGGSESSTTGATTGASTDAAAPAASTDAAAPAASTGESH